MVLIGSIVWTFYLKIVILNVSSFLASKAVMTVYYIVVYLYSKCSRQGLAY